MQEFYGEVLTNLYVYCGNRQAEKMTDEEIDLLIKVLCKVSKVYSYIPEEEQQRIIEKCLIEDKDYQNINARIVSKWLEQNGKKYFHEEAHKETKEFEPATPEQREKHLKEWEKALLNIQDEFSVKHVSKAELMREQLYGKDAKPTGYIPPSAEQVEKKILHAQYLKENYDPITGNCLETWIPEDQWLKSRNEPQTKEKINHQNL